MPNGANRKSLREQPVNGHQPAKPSPRLLERLQPVQSETGPTPDPIHSRTPALPSRPPKMPGDKKSFNRALLLLRCRVRGDELLLCAKEELVGLIGWYPNPETAAVWLATLKHLRQSPACQVASGPSNRRSATPR